MFKPWVCAYLYWRVEAFSVAFSSRFDVFLEGWGSTSVSRKLILSPTIHSGPWCYSALIAPDSPGAMSATLSVHSLSNDPFLMDSEEIKPILLIPLQQHISVTILGLLQQLSCIQRLKDVHLGLSEPRTPQVLSTHTITCQTNPHTRTTQKILQFL